jgi:hypothetical protein
MFQGTGIISFYNLKRDPATMYKKIQKARGIKKKFPCIHVNIPKTEEYNYSISDKPVRR